MESLLRHLSPEEIPASEDLLSADALVADLSADSDATYSLIAVGDCMLGGRTRKMLSKHGPDYPFQAVFPLLQRAPIVAGNLEGVFAQEAAKEDRHYSYRVRPALARSFLASNINVLSLANNHLLDCGRAGVLEALKTLKDAGIASLGAGEDAKAAHCPIIMAAGGLRIGLLAYYWNRRCAATQTLPGSAMDTKTRLSDDIRELRQRVDRVVVFFHWGIPYERQPSDEDRAKARFSIDCGADAVVGHHPHVIQPLELYRGCPIFYSVGNFTFGSGNSRGEGLLLGFKFEDRRTVVDVYPLHVKNRDPRVAYQPKVLQGNAAEHTLQKLNPILGLASHSVKHHNAKARVEIALAAPNLQL